MATYSRRKIAVTSKQAKEKCRQAMAKQSLLSLRPGILKSQFKACSLLLAMDVIYL